MGVTHVFCNESLRIVAYKNEVAISRTTGKAEVLCAISAMAFALECASPFILFHAAV